MASKAYVASMTVAELTSELKQRGLNCRGKKKTLQNRLEEALEDEEMSESSSDGGREATMRAASAVISQLEGGGGGGGRETRGNNNLVVTATPPQEQLVVSIEHSRRQLRLKEPNGNDAKLASEDTSATFKAGIESNNNDVGIVKQPVILTQEPVVPAPMPATPTLPMEPPRETLSKPSPVMKEQLPETEPVVEPKVDSKLGNEERERVSSSPASNRDDTIEHPIIEPQQHLVGSPPTQQHLVGSPPTQQHLVGSPPTQLLVDSASHTPKSFHGGVTPDKHSLSLVSPLTPMDTEAESEVNSVAVEPPSPRDISFVVEEGNTSISGSVELMDVTTPSEVGVDGVTMDTVTMTTGDYEEGGDDLNNDVVGVTTNEVTTATLSNVNGGVVNSQLPQKVREEEGVSTKTSSVGSGGGVDVLVSTVDEDISVFPGEVPAGGNLASDKALQRPDSILKSPTCENKRSFSASESAATELVGGDLVSDTFPGEGEGSETGSKGAGPEERERTGIPSSKRRKMSGSPKRIERRRRWGSNSARTPTQTHTAISSDVLEDIIPDEVKEEMVTMGTTGTSNLTALEAVMNYGVEEEGEGGVDPLTTGKREEGGEDEVKPMEEEDILDLGKESSMVDEYEEEWKEKEREREEQRRESTKAKQELETRRRIEARVRARQQQHDIEVKDKPPLVQRSPSPARRPPSRILHIENLTRPFTNTQLRDLLQEGDNPLVEGGCWTDRIKSHCIAIYVSMESAIDVRNRVHNLKWPRQNPRLLKVDYLTHEEVRDYSNGELEVQPEGRGDEGEAPERPVEPQKKRESPPETNEQAKVNVERRRSTRLSSDGKENVTIEEKPKSMLDKLFRKTKATPPIYWLPLSEKEANDKEIERKAVEEEREKRREERHKEREEMIREREEQRKGRDRSRSPPRGRGRSPRFRRRSSSSPGRRSRSPRRRIPIRRVRSPRRSRSPDRR